MIEPGSAASASITAGEQPAVFSLRCSRSPTPASITRSYS